MTEGQTATVRYGGIATLRLRNRVVPTLFAAAAVAVLIGGFLTLAPNRLVSGRPVGLFAAVDPRLASTIVLLGLALLAISAARPSRALYRASAVLGALLLLLVLAAAGQGAAMLAAGASTLASQDANDQSSQTDQPDQANKKQSIPWSSRRLPTAAWSRRMFSTRSRK